MKSNDGLGLIVSGASSGIGAAIAADLASRGFVVAGLSRRGTVPEVRGSGRVLGYECDVTKEDEIRASLGLFARQVGRIAGLVNNAGANIETPSEQLTLTQLRQTLELNFVSAFSLARLTYPFMKGTGGRIVNIGSFFDRRGVRCNLAYSASKAALASMSRTLAVEWARDGVSVITVAPGMVQTELNREYLSDERRRSAYAARIPVRRLGEVHDIARVVGAIFESATPFLTGTTIYVDGGQGVS